MTARVFQGVSVGVPAGANHHPDNWQNVRWVPLSQGELRIDEASFLLVFIPTAKAGSYPAKPLGCLQGCTILPAMEQGALNTFVVKTNDPVHSTIRIDFQSLMDEENFSKVAEQAEALINGRYSKRVSACGGTRRSSIGASQSQRSSMAGGREAMQERFQAQINERHPEHTPLVYSGVELYGQDPNGDIGSEVLLCRGAVALIDSRETSRVGVYEILFYEEDSQAPFLRFMLGANLKLERQIDDFDARASLGGGRRSTMGRRSSMGLGGPVPSFNLSVHGVGQWGLAFDTDEDAASFDRDMTVRLRLVLLSLKTFRGSRAMQGLQGEIAELRARGLLATLRWLLGWALLAAMTVLACYTGFLYFSDPEKPFVDHLSVALLDGYVAFLCFCNWAGVTLAAICCSVARAVPTEQLARCLALPEAIETRSCVASLSGAAGGTFFSGVF
mmetsp:Transcript_41804/g.89746  ORF Transcript_41804/g.89746 Transcript_41804/m.89746 type:complete len:445 (+) Transcript_41804:63-1397(+)|eukprot:CAMPEP_0206453938 /NCGR_PEP_ID=MMETSP0324_2-20121206/20845_1 /ASSEMBLY_ACC=CAM_ASM_000836 /TAXON_ID=2866 /ORGANISM="Crypthecodinium cohnii, Strain Seligo" /LENGTH=444 /DNA_ID=CAMNT_0053924327 /DNA_START=59 /DNA_END=1393 /DNA_ORIENTATION=-